VELVRLYSNLSVGLLRGVRCACSAQRSKEGSKHPRQHHRRLGATEVAALIETYREGRSNKAIAQRFGIHRVTVTALLRRHGVERRRSGLAPEEVPEAASLYGQGWSLAKLGRKFNPPVAHRCPTLTVALTGSGRFGDRALWVEWRMTSPPCAP